MCRLYGFKANEPTKVECTLVHAQNALMVQSRADQAGYSHTHGWGVAIYKNHLPKVERQAWAAYHGEHFRRAAEKIHAHLVLAHVRRATVGPPALENTHPFRDGPWALIHNGTIPQFAVIRDAMLEAMTPENRAAIKGVTDSEHLFRLFLSLHHGKEPDAPLTDSLAELAQTIIRLCRDTDATAKIGLNLMISDGSTLVGTRWGRTLHYVERDGVYDCEICGFPHIHHDSRKAYKAVVVASEPITHEAWREIPERSIYVVGPDHKLKSEPLRT